jgi:hypothetical protein
MAITQFEFNTYQNYTQLPDIGRRVRILGYIHHVPPIVTYNLYEGIVQGTLNDPVLPQIILNNAINTHVLNGGNGVRLAVPLTNGQAIFPMDMWDFSVYYWKYIDDSNEIVIKQPHYEKFKPFTHVTDPVRLIFDEPRKKQKNGGKSKRKNKKSKKTKKRHV